LILSDDYILEVGTHKGNIGPNIIKFGIVHILVCANNENCPKREPTIGRKLNI